MYQINMYILNLHNVVWQIYFSFNILKQNCENNPKKGVNKLFRKGMFHFAGWILL